MIPARKRRMIVGRIALRHSAGYISSIASSDVLPLSFNKLSHSFQNSSGIVLLLRWVRLSGGCRARSAWLNSFDFLESNHFDLLLDHLAFSSPDSRKASVSKNNAIAAYASKASLTIRR